eukprot:NODE_2829_length_1112_cov_28.761054_g2593_i0.p1 GENE.NODE_2829_length_1112_cov_28.761054_g2593_i0~~NODE_2829_length_1112_cov_28.761054_g2593_i0.p1  ORF type:complete len:263 (+),score=37.29 NODE_2829_length_1112_cov_28.761054_g2593_i0:115-789(+)
MSDIEWRLRRARSSFQHWWRRAGDCTPALIATNVIIAACWRIPRLQATMGRHFLCSVSGVRHGRVWTLGTAAFSHASFVHLGFNMVTLAMALGPTLESKLGASDFMATYLSGAVVSSLGFITHQRIRGLHGLGLGASGCIMTLWGVFASHRPNDQFLIMGMLPVTAQEALLLFLCVDVLGLTAGIGMVGWAAHLSGAAWGVFLYHAWLKDRMWRREKPWWWRKQ